MNPKAHFHIFLQTICLVLTLHIVALSVGGNDYLRLFSSKIKLTNVISKVENEQDADTTDNLPELDNDDDYPTLGIVLPLQVFEKYLLANISHLHSSISLFSDYSTKILLGFSDVILQPPKVRSCFLS